MRTTRQHYIDSNFQAAREAGCDTLQLKYDGWWARFEIENGQATCFTRTGRELSQFAFKAQQGVNATIIGELMFGTSWAQDPKITNKTFAFDLWSAEGVDFTERPYKERYAMMRAILKRLPPSFILVDNFPIFDFPSIWNRFVENGDYEGVVFRFSRGIVDTPLYRQKNVVVGVETACEFEEGQGKFENTLGTVVCQSGARVGGGWDNEERADIWNNKEKYRGRQFEVEGKKRFVETGLLRHPNFVRWL